MSGLYPQIECHRQPFPFWTVTQRFDTFASMASEKEINQRLRSLHQDFDFLLDNNIISTDLYDDLTSQIPRRKSTSSPLCCHPPNPSRLG